MSDESLRGESRALILSGALPSFRGGLEASRRAVPGTRPVLSAVVEALLEGKSNLMVGEIHGRLAFTALKEIWASGKTVDNNPCC